MRIHILVLMLCMSSFVARSQKETHQLHLPKTKLSAQLIYDKLAKGYQHLEDKEGDQAIYTFYEALAASYKLKDSVLIDSTLNTFSTYVSNWLDNFDSLRAGMLLNVLKWSDEIKRENKYTRALENLLGTYYFEINEFEKALFYFSKIVKANINMQSSYDRLNLAKANYNLVCIWIYLSDIDQSSQNVRQLNELAQKNQDNHVEVYSNLAKGKYHLYHLQIDSYNYYLNKSLHFSEKLETTCFCNENVKFHLCEVYAMSGQYQRAIDTLKLGMKHYLELLNKQVENGYFLIYDSKMILYYKFLLGYTYANNKQYTLAEKEIKELLEEKRSRPLPLFVRINCLRVLMKVYHNTKQLEKTIGVQHELINLYEDEKVLIEKNKSIAIKYKTEKEKAVAQQQLIIERQANEIKQNKIVTISASVAIGLLLIIIAGWYRAVKSKQKLQATRMRSLEQEQKLQALQAKIEGEETARKQIARELHDGVGSQLMVAKLSLSTLSQRNSLLITDKHAVADTLHQLETIATQLRGISHNLMPDLILQQGLTMALAVYLERIQKSSKLRIDFNIYGEVPHLSESVTIQLFRAVQEIIQNTIKHAYASRILVQINYAEEILNITFEDDGIGFDLSAQENLGLGLRNIRKRMEELGGTIQFDTQPGEGCTIYLEIDLHGK